MLKVCIIIFAGIFRPQYCPSKKGCRGLLHFDGQTSVNLEDPNIKVVFNNSNGLEIWLVGDAFISFDNAPFQKKVNFGKLIFS